MNINALSQNQTMATIMLLGLGEPITPLDESNDLGADVILHRAGKMPYLDKLKEFVPRVLHVQVNEHRYCLSCEIGQRFDKKKALAKCNEALISIVLVKPIKYEYALPFCVNATTASCSESDGVRGPMCRYESHDVLRKSDLEDVQTVHKRVADVFASEANTRLKRALYMFWVSHTSEIIHVPAVLLFSALEALFKKDRKQRTRQFCKRVSFFLEEDMEGRALRDKNLYTCYDHLRSSIVHGNIPQAEELRNVKDCEGKTQDALRYAFQTTRACLFHILTSEDLYKKFTGPDKDLQHYLNGLISGGH